MEHSPSYRSRVCSGQSARFSSVSRSATPSSALWSRSIWVRPLIGLNYRQSDREAAFRSELIHVRENGESIALLRREGRLTTRLLRRIDDVADNFRRITSVNRNLSFFTTGYNNFIQLIPALIVAPLFIRGNVEFGVITQSAAAFAQLLGAFSLIVNQFQAISTFAAVITRLSAMVGAVDNRPSSASTAVEVVGADGRIAYDGLTLFSPDGDREVLKNLTAEIRRGTNVLVVGPNEAARIALFRATASIWPAVEGTLVRPQLDEIFFLPQRPYLPPGTLRDVLGRSGQEQVFTDGEITSALQRCGFRLHSGAGWWIGHGTRLVDRPFVGAATTACYNAADLLTARLRPARSSD